MAMTKIWDLAYEVNGDTIRVEQDGGTGEVYAFDLHSIHVRLLASELGILQGDAEAWRRVATLERRLRVLHDRIEELDGRLWSVPVYPPGSENRDPDLIYSDCTLDIAREFVADLPMQATKRHETPNPSGTHGEPKHNPIGTRGFDAAGDEQQAGLDLEARV